MRRHLSRLHCSNLCKQQIGGHCGLFLPSVSGEHPFLKRQTCLFVSSIYRLAGLSRKTNVQGKTRLQTLPGRKKFLITCKIFHLRRLPRRVQSSESSDFSWSQKVEPAVLTCRAFCPSQIMARASPGSCIGSVKGPDPKARLYYIDAVCIGPLWPLLKQRLYGSCVAPSFSERRMTDGKLTIANE
jgi:hypothetical protein